MISGMLKIASLNQVIPAKEEIIFNDFAKTLTKRFKKVANIEFIYEEDLRLNSDLDLLDAIFTNLINNSISFAEEFPKIHITIERKLNTIHIDYRDEGPGIDQYSAKSIFNPFIKSTKSQGLGLGMTIVTRSLERLSGKITCEPSDEGAIFKIEITRC